MAGRRHLFGGEAGQSRNSPVPAFSPNTQQRLAVQLNQASLLSKSLLQAVENGVIPRLIAACTPKCENAQDRLDAVKPSSEEVAQFTALLLQHEPNVAYSFARTLFLRGATLDEVCLDLFAPAARLLGQGWVEDTYDFMDVTQGMAHLFDVFRVFSIDSYDMASPAPSGHRILLVPAPGEQHTFGLTLIHDFFRRDGWDVWTAADIYKTDIHKAVASERFDLVGISVGSEKCCDDVTSCIDNLKRASKNKLLRILVGGSIFAENQALVEKMGADATASDARQAVKVARGLVGITASRG